MRDYQIVYTMQIETLARSFPLWRSDNGGSAAAPGAVTLQIRKFALSAYTVAQLTAPADSCYRGSQKAWD